jgi:3-oxoacyl-[acyl-carrier-protein] synthase-3
MFPVKCAGLGAYLPQRRVTSAELEQQLGLSPGWIERRTGVCERRYAAVESAAEMGAAAIRQALAMANLAVTEIDLIIGASSAPQHAIPCTAAFVQRELGAPDGGSVCFDMNATCLTFLFALHTAAQLIAGGAYRTVAIFSSEIASRSLNPQEPESAVLFGDGAAAAILTRTPLGEASAIGCAHFATHSSGAALTMLAGGGTRHHPNDPATTPAMNLFHMDGPAIFKKAGRLLGPFLDAYWAKSALQADAFDWIVPHQASRHGLEFLGRAGFAPSKIIANLATRGNCIAASIPLALTEAVQAQTIRRGDQLLLLGSGAGLTFGAVAVTF